jgi:hypothetical protein
MPVMEGRFCCLQRPPACPVNNCPPKMTELQSRRHQGVLIKTLMKDCDIPKATIYRCLNETFANAIHKRFLKSKATDNGIYPVR